MAARFSIEAVFKAIDKMTGPLTKMQSKNKKFTRALRRDFAKAQRSVDNFGRNLNRNLGRAATRTAQVGIIAIGAGLAIATKEFIAFDQTIVGATARFKDLEIGTEKTALAMAELKKTAREVGAVTQFTATESAAGLNFFAKAGFTSAEAMAALKTQVDLATVAELDLARTSDITSDLLGALGLNAADSATKIDNLAKLSNSLGLAANMANVTLEDIFETLKIAGPIATAAGEDMNTLISLTAALGSAGIKGSMGATAIKNAYLNLATNAPKVEKALAGIGLAQADFVDQRTGTLDMVKAMKLIGDASKDMGNVKQLALFEQIFGKRAIAGAVNISKNLSEIDQIIRALESDKNIADIAEQIRTGLGMQVKILRSGLLELGFKFVEAFEKQGRGALSNLITAVQNFDMQPIIDGVKKAVEIFQKWIPIIEFIAPIVLGIVAAWKAYRLVLFLAAAAQTVLNIAMTANPIGLIITGIGVLIGVIVLLVKNWDKVTAVVKRVWDWFMKLLDNPLIATAALIFAPFIAIPAMIIKHWEPIKNFFLGLWETIKPIVEGIGKFFKGGDGLSMADFESPRRARESGIPTRGLSPQAPISPSERSALIREENISRGEVTIKDDTGRAKMTQPIRGGGFNLNLVNSGGF